MPRDTGCPFYPTHTAPLLIDGEKFFPSLCAVADAFWRENAAGAAVFAQILLIATTIDAIANDIGTAAFSAAMGMGFGNHSGTIEGINVFISYKLT